MQFVEHLQRLRGRLAVVIGIGVPLTTGAAWCIAGRPVLGLLGIAAAVLGARLYRRRVCHPLFLLPMWLTGDPNKRKPLVIERERWPRGQR